MQGVTQQHKHHTPYRASACQATSGWHAGQCTVHSTCWHFGTAISLRLHPTHTAAAGVAHRCQLARERQHHHHHTQTTNPSTPTQQLQAPHIGARRFSNAVVQLLLFRATHHSTIICLTPHRGSHTHALVHTHMPSSIIDRISVVHRARWCVHSDAEKLSFSLKLPSFKDNEVSVGGTKASQGVLL